MKVRIRLPTQLRFYYPDVSVSCRPEQGQALFLDEPTVVMEVLSQSTRRLDLSEKKEAYLAIPSLTVYAVVEQDRPCVLVYRRTAQGFQPETFQGVESIIPLPEIQTELPLSAVYQDVVFEPESQTDDD